MRCIKNSTQKILPIQVKIFNQSHHRLIITQT
nr:MAG TPA: hypothetical protein [Caudoviricetes sp.]